MNQQQIIEQINGIKATLEKVQVEVTAASQAQAAAIEELRLALQNADTAVTPEMIAAIESLKAVADSLDAINPDAPPPVEVPPEQQAQPAQ